MLNQTDISEQTNIQLNHSKDIGIQSNERKSTQQTGTELLNKEEIYQTIVFLPGPDSTDIFQSLVEVTRSAPNEPVTTDTGQEYIQWQVETLGDDISFLDDLLAPIELTAQSVQGELNTPTIEKPKGFDFNGYQAQDVTFNITENKDHQLQNNQQPDQTPAAFTTINNNPENNAEVISYNNIRELLQDDQMFRLDCDPTFFDAMRIEENLNNNIGLDDIKELDTIYSDSWIPAAGDIEIFKDLPDSLFESETMERKETSPSPSSPIPAPPSPVTEAVSVKSENPDFDLIKYIIFGDNADLPLTPLEEKPCPNFEQNLVAIKPEPSTSTASSPKRPEPENLENIKPVRRRVAKRRYSSDSDFSVDTSASSNTQSHRATQKKRGRPAKELITELPTIDDFSHMPREHASHLVLRIKNNEASRKSRMKSKSKQNQMEDECDRLAGRQRRLRTKNNKLEGQIETLRRWLLGLN